MTHENGGAVSAVGIGVGIGVAVAIAIGEHFDTDPDSDPELLGLQFYFRNRHIRALEP